jgi:hypothetical protein
MTRKIVILTEIIAPYRLPVFNALAQRTGLDLHVIFLAETDETLGSGAFIVMKSAFRMKC